MKSPTVSIILSTYNWSKYIKESIISVLNQTYKNFEFIIINDFSIDNVEKIILDLQENDNRIVYIKNKENLKLTKSLNKWIKIAKWKYIVRIDDDDIWLNKKLEEQITFMEKNIEYWLCWFSTIIINNQWKIINKNKMRELDQDIRNNLLKSNQFVHSSVMIRKSILDKAWWTYNYKYNWAEDYELWLRIWKISKLYNISKYLVKYRWLQTSISRKKWIIQELLWFKIIIKYRKEYPYFFKSFTLRLISFLIPEKLKYKIINYLTFK